MSEKETPWGDWFSFGVGVLGLDPTCFWRLSLWEWLALTGWKASREAPTRAELETLLRAHPDSTHPLPERETESVR